MTLPAPGAAGSVRDMSMGGLDPRRSITENYQMFGREARGRSPLYEALAASVAGDEEIMGFVGALPRAKQQPNLQRWTPAESTRATCSRAPSGAHQYPRRPPD